MSGFKAGKQTPEGLPSGGVYGSLKYNVLEAVSLPSDIRLEGGLLIWSVEWDRQDSADFGYRSLVPRSTKGCMEDFLMLAGGTPEDVLAFAERRGVLGICPGSWQEPSPASTARRPTQQRILYGEPTDFYTELARDARLLVESARRLRDGLPIDPDLMLEIPQTRLVTIPNGADPETVTAAFEADWLESLVKSRADLYRWVNAQASRWWEPNTIRIEPRLVGDSAATVDQAFRLSFGHWRDADGWDEKARDYPPWQLEPSGDTWRGSLAMGSPFSLHGCFPSPEQRPSPLFNVLAFQLLAAVTLPAGLYFCAACDEPFTPDTDRNRPRKDKRPLCQKEECVNKRERQRWAESKRKAAEVKRLAEL